MCLATLWQNSAYLIARPAVADGGRGLEGVVRAVLSCDLSTPRHRRLAREMNHGPKQWPAVHQLQALRRRSNSAALAVVHIRRQAHAKYWDRELVLRTRVE